MSRNPLTCHRCDAELAPAEFGDGQAHPCPRCGIATEIRLFPALFRALESVGPAAHPLTDESSCFYHETRRAVVPCDGCGRFLCELCDVPLHGRHLCPNCLVSVQRDDKESSLAVKRTRYDRLALNAVLLSVLLPPLWFLTPFTGPLAVFYAIRYRGKPLSVLPGGSARLLAAGVLGLLLTLVWLGLGLFGLSRIL